jgi:hypothetical protein
MATPLSFPRGVPWGRGDSPGSMGRRRERRQGALSQPSGRCPRFGGGSARRPPKPLTQIVNSKMPEPGEPYGFGFGSVFEGQDPGP